MIHIKRCTRAVSFLLASALLVTMSGRASAGSCTGSAQTITLTLPSSVSVPRDAPVGALLTNWVSSAANTNLWTCSTTAGNLGGRFQAGPQFIAPSGVTYSGTGAPGGTSYTVFQTNVQGVGIALAGNIYTPNAGWNGWQSAPISWSGVVYLPVTTTWSIGAQASVALVKTGTIASGGVIPNAVVLQAAPVADTTQVALAVSYAITPVTIAPMTCTTPDVNVPMGNYIVAQFPSVGSTSPTAVPVNIQLLNCPASVAVSGTQSGIIHSIAYRIDPSAGTLATNVAALAGSPVAGGIGIQLYNASGTVFPLSTQQTLSSFNGASGGDYTIALTAKYYRTGTVTPGPANSTMTLTVSYQ